MAPQILETINELQEAKGLMLRVGPVVDAALIAAPNSTKKPDHARHQGTNA